MDVCERLADLLEYPDERLPGRVADCAAALPVGAAHDAVAAFGAEVDRLGVARLEEIYTATFDLDPACAPYAGHHVLGDNVRRSVLMACLAAQYREGGIDRGLEPPDYLPMLLRYVAREPASAAAVRDELIANVLLPAVQKIVAALEERGNPYRHVVRAVLAELE